MRGLDDKETTEFRALLRLALAEDIGDGDATSRLLIPEGMQAEMAFACRASTIACGASLMGEIFAELGEGVRLTHAAEDGAGLEAGGVYAHFEGDARLLLAGERTGLNLAQRMCGVAALTARYVDAVRGTGVAILDTRKTMPGMRALDKYAVRAGGGENHRFGLYDAVLIKDNHIALAGGVAAALKHAKTALPIIIECDTLKQAEEALSAGAKRLLLDNMTPDDLSAVVAMNKGRAKLEASGGVNLSTVRAIAETGVDYISVGALTHSALAADIGADIMIEGNTHEP